MLGSDASFNCKSVSVKLFYISEVSIRGFLVENFDAYSC